MDIDTHNQILSAQLSSNNGFKSHDNIKSSLFCILKISAPYQSRLLQNDPDFNEHQYMLGQ